MKRELLRIVRMPLAVLVGYAIVRFALDALTIDDGLLTPGGAPRLGVAGLGLLALLLRLVVLFVVPAVLVYRLICFTSHSERRRSANMDP